MLRQISTATSAKPVGLIQRHTRLRKLSTCAALTALATLRTPLGHSNSHSLTHARHFTPASAFANSAIYQSRSMATAAASTSSGLNPFESVPVQWPFVNGSAVLQNVLPGYEVVPATDSSPAYAVYRQPIQRSLNDDREYRLVPPSLLASGTHTGLGGQGEADLVNERAM